MKINILLIVICVFLSSCFGSNFQKEESECLLSSIEIYYVEFEIETAVSVDCNGFLAAFSDVQKLTVTDKKILRKFEQELQSLKLASPDMPEPDTRIKIKVYEKEKETVYCIGQFSIMDGKELYIFSNSFMKLLKEIKVIRKKVSHFSDIG